MVRRVFLLLMSLCCAVGVSFTVVDNGKITQAETQSINLPIIMYHSVSKTNPGAYVVKPTTLEKDLRYLQQQGYQSVTVDEVVGYVLGKGKLPEKPVMLTFDDGFYNNYSLALPLIKKYGFCAVFSVVGKFTLKEEGRDLVSNSYSNLSFADINKIKQDKAIEFAHHTYDMHSLKGRRGVGKLKGESEQMYKKAFTSDVEKNEKLFLERCNLKFDVFTYPFGIYNDFSQEIVKAKGYKACLTCNMGVNQIRRGDTKTLYELKRNNRPDYMDTERFMTKYGII